MVLGARFILDDRVCKECYEYTVPSPNFDSCMDPDCLPNHIISKDGECVKCKEFQQPSWNLRTCELKSVWSIAILLAIYIKWLLGKNHIKNHF